MFSPWEKEWEIQTSNFYYIKKKDYLGHVWMHIFHQIFITQFPLLITHHFKILHPFGTNTQYFSHYLWAPYLSLDATFLFFSQYPETRTRKGKKIIKKNPDHPNPVKEEGKKRKRKKEEPRRREEKKKVGWSKGAAELWLMGPPCVFNYKNAIELWVMETKNS